MKCGPTDFDRRPAAVIVSVLKHQLLSKFSVGTCCCAMEKKMATMKRTLSFRHLLRRQDRMRFSCRKTQSKKMDVHFHSVRGPDVQPPRNDRRTLKLSKSDDQGYGFWLQTYDFVKNGSSSVKKRTFVRYVEDEGPAYLAGLREGDVIVEVNGQNVEDIEHMKIVGLISETAKQLMLVVKFMDMVRRVELAVRLKKNQAKLKLKIEELDKIKEEEMKLYNRASESSKNELSRLSNYSSTYSSSLEGDLDRLSLDTSSESGLGSLSSISDEVVVRTSKFEKRSSRVLDSIKELNCACTTPGFNKTDFPAHFANSPLSTTDNDLLTVYSDNIGACRQKNACISVKRTESMPVQKRDNLYPLRDFAMEVEQNYTKDNQHCHPAINISKSDDMIYDGRLEDVDTENYFSDSVERSIRSKSYKRAVTKLLLESTPTDL